MAATGCSDTPRRLRSEPTELIGRRPSRSGGLMHIRLISWMFCRPTLKRSLLVSLKWAAFVVVKFLIAERSRPLPMAKADYRGALPRRAALAPPPELPEIH